MTTKNLKTWIDVNPDSDFSIYNIPFGIYSDENVEHHACSAIGDYIIDLYELESQDLLDINRSVFTEKYLNSFIENRHHSCFHHHFLLFPPRLHFQVHQFLT